MRTRSLSRLIEGLCSPQWIEYHRLYQSQRITLTNGIGVCRKGAVGSWGRTVSIFVWPLGWSYWPGMYVTGIFSYNIPKTDELPDFVLWVVSQHFRGCFPLSPLCQRHNRNLSCVSSNALKWRLNSNLRTMMRCAGSGTWEHTWSSLFERSEFLIRTLQKKRLRVCVCVCVCVCLCTLLNLVLEWFTWF